MSATTHGTEQLQQERPEWRIWRAIREDGPGSWMATRRHDRTPAEEVAGCDPTLMADDEQSLRAQLEDQDHREARAATR